MSKKIIAVIGATGAQGGGLVRAILADPNGGFAVRALTRDPESPKAKALADLGAEVVAADVDDVASLTRAFEGAHGAFCVTFFWDHLSPEKEGQQVCNMAEAAKAANVQHAIWSTLEDTRKWVPLSDDRMPTLHGKWKVPHFDGKGESDHWFADLGVPTTLLLTTFYWDNFVHFGMGPQRADDGVLTLNLPMGDKPLAGVVADDIGAVAYGIFKAGGTYIGKTVGVAGEFLTGAQIALAFSDVLGQPVRYNAVPVEVYRTLGFPGADDLGNMFQIYQEFAEPFAAARPLDVVRALHPGVQSLRTWLEANKGKLTA